MKAEIKSQVSGLASITLERGEAIWLIFEGKEIHINATESGCFGINASLGTRFRTNARNETEFKTLSDCVLVQSEQLNFSL
jgi:hypothetical protein